jgi:hypothetical protein
MVHPAPGFCPLAGNHHNKPMETDPITTKSELLDILARHPDLCYEGWRTPDMSDARLKELRDKLLHAYIEFDLCRRAFRDPDFRKKYRGINSAYGIKHAVEKWDFDPPSIRVPSDWRNPTMPHYNGIYVCQGVAAAAAMLEGLPVLRRSLRCPGSVITFPVPPRRVRNQLKEAAWATVNT